MIKNAPAIIKRFKAFSIARISLKVVLLPFLLYSWHRLNRFDTKKLMLLNDGITGLAFWFQIVLLL
jgi:hypothetical protein